MTTVEQICAELALKPLTNTALTREAKGCYVCDLLSRVMARGEEGMVWVTVQTHLNVLAVACLHEFSCVIIPEGIAVPQETLDKANEEGIPVLSGTKTAYEICAGLARLGV